MAKRVGDSVTLAAFGGTDCTQKSNNETKSNTKLSATTLEVFSYQYCNDYIQQLGGTDRLPDGFISNILCVGSNVIIIFSKLFFFLALLKLFLFIQLGGHSSCPGDSGGPLVKSKEDSDGKRYHEQIAVVGGATKDRKVGFYARLEDAEILNWVYDVAFDRHGKANFL